MLKSTVIGNLGAHAKVRNVNGVKAISFSVAHNEQYKDSEGIKHEKTLWVNCTFWRTKETNLIKFLKKGQLVYVEGTPSVGVYRNKEGIHVADYQLRVTNIQLLGSRSDDSEQPTESQKNGQAQAPHQQAQANGQNHQQQRPAPQGNGQQQPQANGNGQQNYQPQPQQQTTPIDDVEVPWME